MCETLMLFHYYTNKIPKRRHKSICVFSFNLFWCWSFRLLHLWYKQDNFNLLLGAPHWSFATSFFMEHSNSNLAFSVTKSCSMLTSISSLFMCENILFKDNTYKSKTITTQTFDWCRKKHAHNAVRLMKNKLPLLDKKETNIVGWIKSNQQC